MIEIKLNKQEIPQEENKSKIKEEYLSDNCPIDEEDYLKLSQSL